MNSPEIIYEDNHILAVNKPAGMLVQGDKSGDTCILDLVKRFLKERDGKPGNVFLGLPHRLDRPTSGVLVLAKTSKALSRLAASFRDRDVSKIYWAVVESRPENAEGELTDWLKKDGRTNTSRKVNSDTPGAKEARLRYRILGASEPYWLVEVELLTGRHHQIRVQLSAMGCRIKGDLKYGAKMLNRGEGIYLHARYLETSHPTRDERLKLTAPPPVDALWKAIIPE
ncbi:MAG: RNA pseudouridine synthase [Deltaproteobacteria bacterium]|nr:MAG: RNA pseudouridine synthase [Deltaproteobacteria bacterium]